MTITDLHDAIVRSGERRQQRRRLREEFAGYRTPAERAELEAILARHDTSVPELLQRV